MTDISLQFCYLMDQHPLHRYVRCDKEGKKLPVLLLGKGERFETILKKLLTVGQLLDTELEITLVSENAAQLQYDLMAKAPSLGSFVTIEVNGTRINTPEVSYGLLRFEDAAVTEQVEQLLKQREEPSYVLICTEDDEENNRLAAAFGQHGFCQQTLIAYVQEEEPESLPACVGRIQLCPFGYQEEGAAYHQRLERIAFNLHYSYAKSKNEREKLENIRREFETDPYIHLSNLENAVHMRSKLAVCGIEVKEEAQAAKAFYEKLKGNDALVEQLAALEHRRWVLEKVLDGYGPVPDIRKIFSRPGVTNRDKEEGWHVCVVPCDETGRSSLTPEDWQQCGKSTRPELDELDRMSLAVHQQCQMLAQTRRTQIERTLRELQAEMAVRSSEYEAVQCIERLTLTVALLYQQKHRAISMFEQELEQAKKWVESLKNEKMAQMLCDLAEDIKPLVEYVGCVDYKELDHLLVRQIPFALTFYPGGTLVKLMSQQPLENVLSAVCLEAERLVLVGIAESRSEWQKQIEQIERISSYFHKRGLTVEVLYRFFVPAGLGLESMEGVEQLPNWSTDAVMRQMKALLDAECPAQIDISGGEPELFAAVKEWSDAHSGIGIFHRNGRLRGLDSSCEVRYDTLHRSLSVDDVFTLKGAVKNEDEFTEATSMTEQYDKLWRTVNAYRENWGGFCEAIKTAVNKSNKREDKVVLRRRMPPAWKRYDIHTTHEKAWIFVPVLRRLQEWGYLSGLFVINEGLNGRYISFHAVQLANGKNLGDFLAHKAAEYHEGVHWEFEQPWNSDTELWCHSWMFRTGVNGKYAELLGRLCDDGFLSLSLVHNDGTKTYQILSPELKHCIALSGTVLEYYLYYTALLDCRFDDVEMGWSFRHSSASNAANNEIDVICTKGATSLFISAKFRKKEKFEEGDSIKPLNNMLYEILQLSVFGMNTRVALAAPFLPMFENGSFSKYMKAAQRRGVYLIGEECFAQGKLAKVLDAVADGREDWYLLVKPT